MKIRSGFVSNSSSSSYVCDTCEFSEYTWDYPDGFKYCDGGHGLCEGCYSIDRKKLEEIVKLPIKEIVEFIGYNYDPEEEWCKKCIKGYEKYGIDYLEECVMEDDLPTIFCPVCCFEVIIDSDLKKYMKKISQISEDVVFQYVKSLNKRRKKLYPHEYITYVCGKMGTNTIELTKEVKEKFSSYKDFKEFIK